MLNLKENFFKTSIVIFVLLLFPSITNAASLYFSPSLGNYTVGSNFNIGVYVSDTNKSVNAVSGKIIVPSEFEFVSISKNESIVDFWVQEPSYDGTYLNFEGIILNPGFLGSAGKIISVNFKAKSIGNVNLSFTSSSVLANDGFGTNILEKLENGNYVLNPIISDSTADISTTPIAGTPYATSIVSSSHSDSSKWYQEDTAHFSWDVPDGTISTRLSLNKKSNAVPSVVYTEYINNKTISDLTDGVWYFHVQLKNNFGWGSISHYKIQVDTTPPESFNLKFVENKKDLQPSVLFSTKDVTSGIDYYQINIDNNDPIFYEKASTEDNLFVIPLQNPGNHLVAIKAYDKAGNHATASGSFETVAINYPTITEYPYELNTEDVLVIRGSTYPNATVRILLTSDDEILGEQEIKANEAGNFVLVWENKLKKGVYKFKAQAIDENGAKSLLSNPFIISVKGSLWNETCSIIVYFVELIGFLGILIMLLFVGWKIWCRFKSFKKRLAKEIAEVDAGVEKVFKLLREDVREHIDTLNKAKKKRSLTDEETKILKGLIKNFNDAEKYLKKEIKDVEKEIEAGGNKKITKRD